MCLKENACTTIIMICGLLVAAFGLIMLGMAINVSVKAGWIDDLLKMDESGSTATFLKAGKVLLYIVGIYLLIMGGLSVIVKKVRGKICATIYGIAVIPVFVLMLVMSIPVLTIYGISEDNINQICAVAANDSDLVAEPVKADVKADAGRLLQAAETTSLRQDAEKKRDEFKAYSKDKFNSSVKKMYEFLGPIIKQVDTAAANASSTTMCRQACPCKPITPAGLLTYSTAFQTQAAADKITYTTWKAGNQSTNYDGYRFDGKIDMFATCYAELMKAQGKSAGTAVELEKCVDDATSTKKETKKKTDQAKRLAAEAKCKGTKAVKENIMGLIKTIETTLNCQGMCQETTFWWNKDITVSAPEQGCLIGIKNEFKGSSGAAAIVMIVAIVISFCLAVCSFGSICTKKDEA